ncbi:MULTISPECIES: bifunctional phosphoribosylaminoimidazolecarboxamide formyltransferase/IMP cyclohydrolase [unclassified Nesterenkonia]|uniref:bifunctional phosphoribosylaminoimidazolecarboxamide formyltransferase/IMP cyclohydrolase n=1 Tax=unclassified Nesterenkonia TaxID=2629769 RepID=UPI000872D981|nr:MULTISPECIES: bifunctional phosphoribosylaminoimidazolecarboxamide formyltransferase/IMP cyclohydrolase [unclassified Nesterenkonia]MDS2173773.1 bifunctional phosphoribosylaminoimidazolecarboxamide formyltransferase/IMP cyclohydrolase [Nesterenkonia sp. CL21]OSM44363.1 bifunctional phosphoribosylaminoimidazolecarboxamide formyltransferase/IMP cyclohydrolase [Nesterenkonia sp. PF2B19]
MQNTSPSPEENSSATDRQPIRRALVSVFDKTGLTELAQGLHAAGVELVSTGSTAQRIADAGVPVTEVSEVTGFAECLDGRVKTLHPRVHAGILADRRREDHRAQLDELEIRPFDLVVVNLYPFAETVASGASEDEIVEKIDIGGPSMVRAAAKNHASVAVVVDPLRYGEVITAAEQGGFTLATRQRLAALAFAHTAAYDTAVARWTSQQYDDDFDAASVPAPPLPRKDKALQFPPYAGLALQRITGLRYGENSHQPAALYTETHAAPGLAQAETLHGKAMSYNNYVDADAAVRTAYDFAGPAVAIIKHANPCGVAVGETVAEAHRRAHACDPLSAFGGVIAANRTITAEMAGTVAEIFTEVVVAPDFEPEALEILTRKKNIRLLRLPEGHRRDRVEYKQISGGMLLQASDALDAEGDVVDSWKLVSGEAADEATLADLEFAWRAVRSVKSNAILLAREGATVGIGMGQVNRLDSCRLAVQRANTLAGDGVDRARGSVAASDAFFPFADGLQSLIAAGVRAVVQPGGSQRDQEVVDAAEEAGLTMYLTGARHFFH